jgi:putative tryptophan/tyrosine transport system substrate-binding protein
MAFNIRRRQFISALGGAAATAWPLAARAQQPVRVFRIGYLGYSSPALEQNLVGAFRQGLGELGYVDGQNFAIEYRSAEGKLDRLPELAVELVGLNVNVIVTLATPGALAAKKATNTIPIVVAAMADPARDGLVASLARPGGNITGSTFLGPELIPKRLELLKEVVPSAIRVAVLWHPAVYGERTMADMLKQTEVSAQALALQLQLLGAEGPGDFDGAFSAMRKDRADALLVFPSPMLYLEYRHIVDLAAKNRLPAVYPWREAVDAGGLISYGASIPDLMRRAGIMVGKILKGTKPVDLPVEQPTKFDLVINLKTAKSLGLGIPQTLQASADEVIE